MAVSAKVGYVRISTVDQNTSRQLVNLKLDRIFEEKVSGKSVQDRPILNEMISYVRDGDELYVHSMDRLARNLEDLLKLVHQITNKGVTSHFVKENLNFEAKEKASPMSKFLLSVTGAVSEFERVLILERQREGIAQAKARGAYKGRKPVDAKLLEDTRQMLASGKSKSSVAKQLGIARTTLYKYLSSSIEENSHD